VADTIASVPLIQLNRSPHGHDYHQDHADQKSENRSTLSDNAHIFPHSDPDVFEAHQLREREKQNVPASIVGPIPHLAVRIPLLDV